MPKIIICGKAASGKTFLKDYLLSNSELKGSVSHTTRPKREGEKDGVDYYFVKESSFLRTLSFNPDAYMEWEQFNRWYYATPYSEWKDKDVFIMTPSAIKKVSKEDTFIIYLDIEEKIRRERLKKRTSSADNVERRIESDERLFIAMENIETCLRITDAFFNPEKILHIVKNL